MMIKSKLILVLKIQKKHFLDQKQKQKMSSQVLKESHDLELLQELIDDVPNNTFEKNVSNFLEVVSELKSESEGVKSKIRILHDEIEKGMPKNLKAFTFIGVYSKYFYLPLMSIEELQKNTNKTLSQ